MCGILGIKLFNREPEKSDRNLVEAVLTTQLHRGPDFQQVMITGNAVLGHNRLAILDLNPRSNQPFTDRSQRYSLVFNGEIYNYGDLKNRLLSKGVEFSTASDTEVLLYHLIENGVEGITELDGCFAFAFYDKLEDELILARDPMGINPLLFSIEDERICFASELWPFASWVQNKSISKEALSYFFQYTYIPAPLTILEGVQKLMPGHYLKIKQRNLDIVQYFNPEAEKLYQKSYDEACQELKVLLENAVIKRMEAHVPLGTFLSGGLDSSIVSAIAAKFRDGLQTYSVGFSDYRYFDESAYAGEVAKYIGSSHHPIQLSKDVVKQQLKEVLQTFDEPFGDSSAIAMYFLSQYVTKDLTVCLSGDGADELFAGYNKHKAFHKLNSKSFSKRIIHVVPSLKKGSRNSKLANKWRQINKFKELTKLGWPANYWYLASFNEVDKIKTILPDFNPVQGKIRGAGSLSDVLLNDQYFVLPNDMLKKVDLMSMRHSLEVRVPFLDKEVVKFANSLPENFKLRNGKTKAILRDTFGNDLPESIFKRGKQGFEVPLEEWVKECWTDLVDERWFDEGYLKEQGIFNPSGIRNLKHQFLQTKSSDQTTLVWCYLVFQQWFSNFEAR
jgi:asparagine synthase (glutamine-hydrolysing)